MQRVRGSHYRTFDKFLLLVISKHWTIPVVWPCVPETLAVFQSAYWFSQPPTQKWFKAFSARERKPSTLREGDGDGGVVVHQGKGMVKVQPLQMYQLQAKKTILFCSNYVTIMHFVSIVLRFMTLKSSFDLIIDWNQPRSATPVKMGFHVSFNQLENLKHS